MTEAEWLTSATPGPLVEALADRASGRKWRLFACACCRRAWSYFTDPRCRAAVEASEQFADGRTDAPTMAANHAAAFGTIGPGSDLSYLIGQAAATASAPQPSRLVMYYTSKALAVAVNGPQVASSDPLVRRYYAAACDLLRDIFGSPFRPVTFSPSWRTDTAVSLARQMYDARDFSAMPILADALQDAGCDNESVLSHCRGPELHARGCWVVDLILVKE